ncbi:MAG: Lysophospholipase L1-like esterase [Acidobacteriales bacterium]|nr:Lysophospholipase L1-like esterase [Terriglobales bacterium]
MSQFRSQKILVIAAWILISASATSAQKAESSQKDFALKDGDRVVFFGDSITQQRLYTSYVQQFVLSRYPERKIVFINSGWGGDTVSANPCVPCAGVGALARIDRDVIAHKPTVVTILFGMNDGLYKDFDPAVMNTYTDGMDQIIHILKTKAPHARIYLMTPTVFDGTRHGPTQSEKYNEVLDKYSEAVKEIAAREKLPVIDLHTATGSALMAAKQAQADYTFEPDAVHPGPDGHAVMAAAIVRAWGAPEKGIVVSQRFSATHFSVTAPLPWPAPILSERMRQAEPSIGNVGAVTLRLTGVPRGNYELSVDGKEVGKFTAAELEQGIPIGMSEQAAKGTSDLAKAVRDKEDVEYMRWRDVQLRFEKLKSASSAAQALDALAREANEFARTKAQPRKYEIKMSAVQ